LTDRRSVNGNIDGSARNGHTDPVTTRKEQAEQSRTRLIETALRLFLAQGYEATSVSEILDEAGMARGALYHHFPDGKRELFAEVVEYVDEPFHHGLEHIVATVASPVERIIAAWKLLLSLAAQPAFARIVLVEATAVDPGGWTGQGQYVLLRVTVEEAIAAGELRPMPVDAVASTLFGAIRRMADFVAVAPDPAVAAREGDEVLTTLLEGLRPTD
jgi:AcrR family transcriptional regulator